MEKFFNCIRCGSPFCLYILSLFITTNIYGILCNGIVSALTFVTLSVIYSLYIHTSKLADIFKERKTARIIFIPTIISIVYSFYVESEIYADTFHVVSDAASDRTDMAIFIIIIALSSAIIAMTGVNTLVKCSNILILLPVMIIIPCIFASAQHGFYNITSFTAPHNFFEEICKGIIAFGLFSSDLSFIFFRFGKDESKDRIVAVKVAVFSHIFILGVGIILSMIFGKELYSALISPLFALSGATHFIKFDEILLIIFSICILFRTGCKICFIADLLSNIFKHPIVNYLIATSAIALSGALGVIISSANTAVELSVNCVLNILSYLLLPLIIIILKDRKKSKVTDSI